ncbi:MAG: peptidoglycan-binding protein [Jatrophihabitantaceae bacterium]
MRLRTTLSRFTRLAAVALCALPMVTAIAAAPAAEAASLPSLHAPYFGPNIEPLADYVPQNSCQPGFRAGTGALARLLVSTYPNTTAGGPRSCAASATSEHYDGRAVDWMDSMRVPVQFMQAASVIKFLLATDAYGNKFAMARRMGIMYIIWDNHIWGTWSGRWEDYNGCPKTPAPSLDNACHRNHMHFSLSWDGALGLTSFWSRRVISTTDYGPCRPSDLNWAADYASYRGTPCPSYPRLAPQAGSSAVYVGLVSYSGAALYPGMSGEPVLAIQRAFNKPLTGRYDAVTTDAMVRFKRAHRLPGTAVVDPNSWRALLAAFRPAS